MLAPFVLAESRGYYAREGLRVTFRTVAGGVKVGEALARGEGDLGGASGDTPMLLRERGVPIRSVALLGGHAFLTMMTDHARHVPGAGPQGMRFGVPAFADVSFYALDAFRRGAGVDEAAMKVEQRAASGLWAGLAAHELDGIVGTVDWGVRAERGGVVIDYTGSDRYFPAMAQTIIASDAMIGARPAVIRRFVRATLRAMGSIRRDPARAAHDFVAAVPQTDLREAEVTRTFALLGQYVYSGQRIAGAFAPARVAALQQAYLQRGLIARTPDYRVYFTNRFTR